MVMVTPPEPLQKDLWDLPTRIKQISPMLHLRKALHLFLSTVQSIKYMITRYVNVSALKASTW